MLLEVEDLAVTFHSDRDVRAVDGVSFAVDAGEVVGLVGESGCGKSVTSLALIGLLANQNTRRVRVEGRASFDGLDLLRADARTLRDIRGREIAMIFQDPLSSLNPVVPIGVQVGEVLIRHRGLSKPEAQRRSAELLERVGIPDPTRRLKEYPHQLSGGMRQRALIAMAVACRPRLLIADEPTTALDVTIQAQILELLKELVREDGTAMIMITHDLGVVAGLCDTVNVLYAGRVVESAHRHPLFGRPVHPYTVGLLHSIPRLDEGRGARLTPIRGSVRDVLPWTQGCAFAPRCDRAIEECLAGPPPLAGTDRTPGGSSTALQAARRERLPGEPSPAHTYRCVNPEVTP
jgi:peptide/nickel transport system ATP-binding protein